jgi:hypothetical protein
VTRLSQDVYIGGRLYAGFDYTNQAWVEDGVYVDCGHPGNMNCGCYGRMHAGEKTKAISNSEFIGFDNNCQ